MMGMVKKYLYNYYHLLLYDLATLYQKYAALKTKVGGNRELFGYEETFGMPREEQQHITPPPRHIIRILATNLRGRIEAHTSVRTIRIRRE